MGVWPASVVDSQPGMNPPGRGSRMSATPPMMKEPASVTMIAGNLR